MPKNMQFFAHTLSSVKCVKIFNESGKIRSDYCIFSRANAYAWKKSVTSMTSLVHKLRQFNRRRHMDTRRLAKLTSQKYSGYKL